MAIIEHAGYYEDPMPGVSHEHFCCELMYITEGELDITAKETYHIYANDLVLIKSSQHHRVRVTTSAEYHRYIVMINPWELRNQLVRPDLFAMLTDTSKEGIIIVRNDPELRSGFDKMTDIFTNGANIYTELGDIQGALERGVSHIVQRNAPYVHQRDISHHVYSRGGAHVLVYARDNRDLRAGQLACLYYV